MDIVDDNAESAHSPSHSGLGKKLLPRALSTKRPWKRPPSLSPSIDSVGSSRTNGQGDAEHDMDADVDYHTSNRSSPRRRRLSSFSFGHGSHGAHGAHGAHAASRGNDADAQNRRGWAADDSDGDLGAFGHISHSTTSSSLAQNAHLRDPRDADLSFRHFSHVAPNGVGNTNATLDTPSEHGSASPTGLAPPLSKVSRRSTSPAGRLRSVFRSKKSPAASIASGDSYSPERPWTTENADRIGRRSLVDQSTSSASSKFSDSPALGAHTASFPRVVVQSPDIAHAPDPDDASKPAPGDSSSRLSRGRNVARLVRPETPPTSNDANHGPVIVNTPPTPTDRADAGTGPRSRMVSSPDTIVVRPADSENTIAHQPTAGSSITAPRRARAGSASLVPSRLSNYTLAPLTPTPENGPSTPSGNGGFFSSVLSAAQNATSSLSHTITSSTPWSNSSKKTLNSNIGEEGSQQHDSDDGDGLAVEANPGTSFASTSSTTANEPAVKTLGMGDLHLSHLGISEQPLKASSSAPTVNTAATSGTAAGTAVPPAAASAQNRLSEVAHGGRSRSGSAPPESFHFHSELSDLGSERSHTPANGARPPSVSDATGYNDDHITPSASIYGDKINALPRTGSIRSVIERRRHRGSSAATGGTIAAAIAAANASVAHPIALSGTPKLTGFAVASKKRNRDFHNIFKSVPDDDYLIEDYSCALQREILAHGRLYVSEGYLCFSSNILGWVTTLVMSFDEIVSVEKRSTALVFKNGLMISTLHAKHIFASFVSRDSTYDLIVKIWKLGHPSLQSSLNGVRIDETGGDKTEKIEDGDGEEDASTRSVSGSESISDSDDYSVDVYDEDAEDDASHDAGMASELNGATDATAERSLSRKTSGTGPVPNVNGTSADKASKDASAASTGGQGFPGPTAHAPTDCGDAATHYDKILVDEVVPAPLGQVFSYMFGAASVTFMPKWLANEQKCFDLQMDKKALGPDTKSRTYSYTKPLGGSIGPKQTKCNVTEQIEAIDFEKAVNVVCSTNTPDVPNGNIFTVKTKYCLSWGENNGTRVQMNCTIEWSGKSWLKVAIEKGANDGQAQYGKDILAGIKEALRSRSGTASNGAGGKNRKKGRKSKVQQASGPARNAETKIKKHVSTRSDWGALEPLHGLLEPLLDLIQPLLTGNVMYGILVGMLVATWFRFGALSNGGGSLGDDGRLGTPRSWGGADRAAAYDEMWRREENALWEWLEERVGLERLGNSGNSFGHAGDDAAGGSSADHLLPRKRVLEPRTLEEKLLEERMDEREIREAIRVTEEKLQVLKEVVGKRESSGKP